MARFEVFKDKADQWRYRVRAGNNEIVAQSEAYESEENARRGIEDLLDATYEAKHVPIKRVEDAA